MKTAIKSSLLLLFCLSLSWTAAGCSTNEADSQYVKVDGLYQCKDCGEVLDWLHQTAI